MAECANCGDRGMLLIRYRETPEGKPDMAACICPMGRRFRYLIESPKYCDLLRATFGVEQIGNLEDFHRAEGAADLHAKPLPKVSDIDVRTLGRRAPKL